MSKKMTKENLEKALKLHLLKEQTVKIKTTIKEHNENKIYKFLNKWANIVNNTKEESNPKLKTHFMKDDNISLCGLKTKNIAYPNMNKKGQYNVSISCEICWSIFIKKMKNKERIK